MADREQFEAHIKTAAWYGVLSEAAKDDDDGASIFRMARMAASEAWQASRRAALEEAWAICNANAAKLKGPKETASGYVALVLTADDIRALATETNNG